MKGVILVGGSGSRLDPLTRVTNKHLLPVYDKPMVFYPLQALANAGITDIMLVTGGNNAGDFQRLLGNGSDFGLKNLRYAYQDRPAGIAHALGLDALTIALHGGEDFELCLTAPAGAAEGLEQGFRGQFDGPLTRIGTIQADTGVTLCHSDGGYVPLVAGGYDHFHE